MSELRVPKSLNADEVAWSFRRGVTHGIWMRQRRVVPSYNAYANAPTTMLNLADRVRVEWMRRHPVPSASKEKK